MTVRETVDFGGRPFTIEMGRLAKQANGTAWVEYGDSRVLVTACSSGKEREGIDFFPLTVDYFEKMFSVGRFPGGYIKRESRPQAREVLISRMIDRPIRPLFPEGFKAETQVIATVFCADMENETDLMAMIGASAALVTSDIPFERPIAGVRVGLVDGEYICNPSPVVMENSKLDIFMAASSDAIVMVEGEALEASEEEMIEALMKGFEWVQPVIEMQLKLRESVGKPKWEVNKVEIPENLLAKVRELAMPGFEKAYQIKTKLERYAVVGETKKAVKESLADLPDEEKAFIGKALEEVKYHYVRSLYIKDGRRIDYRDWNEVRPITIESSLLPRVHGSALFTRGETMAMCTVTLGTSGDSQRLDDILGDRTLKFLLHYNFPPFSVGEVKRLGSPGRREIGHGNLAYRALKTMVPIDSPEFPYVVRIVSDILESNGSSSMATVCGGCLAMMDAGVPLRKPVAGIAMGLMKEGDTLRILSDILGDEDHLGDMDFKVCGTADGITALQMDLKIDGTTREVLSDALSQAKEGRLHILGKMLEHLPEPRKEYSDYAPHIVSMQISVDRIRDVIGAGGKTIREIVEQTGCKIDVADDGLVTIASSNLKDCEAAMEIIKGLTEEPEIGKVYSGKVKRITDFGAFVEIIPGIEGLLHISEVAWTRTERMEGTMNEGDIIEVKLVDMERGGKMRLSMKALQPKPEGYVERERTRDDRGPSRGGSRDNRRGGGPRNRR